MNKTRCYSVRVDSLTEISEKAVRIRTFDGSEDVFPKSCIFEQDFEVQVSEAWYIAAWILENKNIQYSRKKERWFDDNGRMLPNWTIEKHVPAKVENAQTQPDESLVR